MDKCPLCNTLIWHEGFKGICYRCDLYEDEINVVLKIKTLTIQDKFKIVEATKQYPLFSREDINIDDEWNKRIATTITLSELENILKS